MQSKPKGELLRLAKTAEGVRLDPTGKSDGRGVYICKGSEECFRQALKRRAIGRSLGVNMNAEDYAILEKEYEEYAEKNS